MMLTLHRERAMHWKDEYTQNGSNKNIATAKGAQKALFRIGGQAQKMSNGGQTKQGKKVSIKQITHARSRELSLSLAPPLPHSHSLTPTHTCECAGSASHNIGEFEKAF